MTLDDWRAAVRRYMTRNDQPTMACPRCKVEMPDFDGLGVIYHPECGYCRHMSRSGDKCDYCGGTPPIKKRGA